MIREVQVNRLPEGLSFPRDLRERIHYDANGHKLAFEGFMSKATYDRLYQLAEDREYRRALEELFQVCTFDDSSPEEQRRARVFVGLAIGLASVGIVVGLTLLFLS